MKLSAIAIQAATIFLLLICVAAGNGQANSNIIDISSDSIGTSSGGNPGNSGPITESSRAQMLVPFSQLSKDDFVIDVSEGSTQYMEGAVSIPYMSFYKDKKLKSMDEISALLRDAGVPCDRPVYIYGECMPCGGGTAPAAFVYLIMQSIGYQVRLIDGTIGQWAASGGTTTDMLATKPKTSCNPKVDSNAAEPSETAIEGSIAAGNGSRTDGGFAGTIISETEDSNGTFREEIIARFEANSTATEEASLTGNDTNIRRVIDQQVHKDPGLDQDYENTCDRDMGIAISLLVGVIGKISYYENIRQTSLSEMQAVEGLGRRLISPDKPKEKPSGQRRNDEPEEPETRVAQATAWLPSNGVFEEEPPGPRRIATPEEYQRVLDPTARFQDAQHNLMNLYREKKEHVKFIRDLKYFGNCTRSLPPWVYVLIDDWEFDQGIIIPWPSNLPSPTQTIMRASE